MTDEQFLERIAVDLPPPRPALIELDGDRFIVDPALPNGAVDYERIKACLAMTPAQRLHRHECWRQFVRDCERRGISVEAAVYGNASRDESR